MKISLNEFEHQIEEKILKRGFDYFKKGYVTDVDELGDGGYEITVEGSETYTVRLSIKENIVTEFECDCPYDMGPICKHVAATLFYLQKERLETIELPVQKTPGKAKEMSASEQTKQLLKLLSHDDLKAFIFDNCAGDNKFRQLFVAKHIHLLYTESKELYTKQLQALIKTYSDRHGFVGYREARRLGSIVTDMAEKAMTDLANGQIQKSMFIALAIIEEMSGLLNDADDSDGQIGGSIEEGFAVLEALTEYQLSKPQHEELFDYLFALFENNSLKGWDWHFKPIALSINLLKTDREKQQIKSALDKIKPTGKSWDWDYRKAQELMLALIKKTENEDAAERFVEKNLSSNPQFRIELIEKYLKTKDYLKVESLAYEGIARDEKDAPGLADDWRNYLLTLYQQIGDTKNTIKFARYFLVHTNGRHHPLKYYYDLLKALTAKDQWIDYLDNVIVGIKSKSCWNDYDRISQLYIWEVQWDKLYELLRQNVSFERVAGAEQYLSGLYPKELATLYKDLILFLLERNMGRPHYQNACRYIRRMIKLGVKPMADALVLDLKKMYPGRRALLEELSNI
jgi:hypothetical protein